MRSNKGRDTSLEWRIRRRLHAAGFRYRVDYAPVPGLRRRADIVFPRIRLAIYLDGCFWHGCPDHYSAPKSNQEFWEMKLSRNRARDRDTDARLTETGWTVLRFWEHQTVEEMFTSITDKITQLRAAHH